MAENDKAKDDKAKDDKQVEKEVEKKVNEIMAKEPEPRAPTEEERKAMIQRLRDKYGPG